MICGMQKNQAKALRSKSYMPHNKQMQSDQATRFARVLAADARRYAARIDILILVYILFSVCGQFMNIGMSQSNYAPFPPIS